MSYMAVCTLCDMCVCLLCLSANTLSFQAILVSESEYVRSELLILQKNLKVLEERGFTIERDIRVAMAKGSTSCCVMAYGHCPHLSGNCLYVLPTPHQPGIVGTLAIANISIATRN